MLWAIIGVLFILWLFGFFVIHLFGGLIHLLLILLIIL
ncbi:lmo0937 family membrane protein, partial [Ethanoligenens sp.]